MTKKFTDYQPRVSWSLFINGYLHAAPLNLEEMKRFVQQTGMTYPATAGRITDPRKLAWVDYFIGYFHLWMPTIFSIRHACELVLKSISIRLYEEFTLAITCNFCDSILDKTIYSITFLRAILKSSKHFA